MTLTSKKDYERVFFSISIAVIIHLFIFFVLPLMVNFHTRELPRYSGPIYVTLGEIPSVSLEKQAENKEVSQPLKSSVVKAAEPAVKTVEKTAGKSSEKSPAKSSALGSLGSLGREGQISGLSKNSAQVNESETGVLQRASWKELPSGKTAETAASSAEKGSSALLEERTANIPFVPPVPAKETESKTKEQYGTKQAETSEKQANTQVLGEKVYSSLDKLLKGSSGSQSSAGSVQTGSSNAESSEAEISPSGSGVPIQWEEPSAARKALYMPKPTIPKWVSREGVKLLIVISFKLLPEGIISEINVEKSSGYSDVDAVVTEALRRWRFQAVRGNRVVSGRITYIIKPE